MRILFALVLILLGLSAEAAAPVISCTPSRTSGTAPLGVVMDCTGTTDGDTSKPFHDLFYEHSFGDPNSGTWTYGANTNLQKNYATGPVAGHVYETAGTYVITSQVSDGTNLARTTNTITVDDPDTTFSGTNTVCFFNSTVGSGCPAGATQTSSSDWDAANLSCLAAGKRCLFKRGDTFSASDAAYPWYTGVTIGAYGSGAKPIVNLANDVVCVDMSNAAVQDVRVMDIDCVGPGNNGNANSAFHFAGSASQSQVTLLRVVTRATKANGVYMTGSKHVIQDSSFSTNNTGVGVQIDYGSQIAVLGNTMGPNTSGFQVFRSGRLGKSVVGHNTFTDSTAQTSGTELVAIRADVDADSQYTIFSDNKIVGVNLKGEMLKLGNVDFELIDQIIERNWIVAGSGSPTTWVGMKISASRTTIRNNLIDASAAPAGMDTIYLIQIYKINTITPDDVTVYNNTLYAGTVSTTGSLWPVIINAGPTNTIIKNNLARGTNAWGFIADSGTSTTVSTNSSDGQTTGTNPMFDNTALPPQGFRIGTGSYAATGGTAIWPASNDDFLHCDDSSSNERLGAFVPGARAQCKSSAGP